MNEKVVKMPRQSNVKFTTKERQAFEQTVLRSLKSIGAKDLNVLVAVSGGVDSIVLLSVMKQWSRSLNLKLTAAYIHHGVSNPIESSSIKSAKKTSKSKQTQYRDKAKTLVEKFCEQNEIAFVTNTPPKKVLKSEDDFRQYRWAQLEEIAGGLRPNKADNFAVQDKSPTKSPAFIATAHHADDLIETQLLRLLRGTGAQGLTGFTQKDLLQAENAATALESPDRRATHIIRPLLEFTKEQIRTYARTKKLSSIEDPTNEKSDALRNWLRHSWLTALAKRDKQKGTNLRKSLAGSLAALASPAKSQVWPETLFVSARASTAKMLRNNNLVTQKIHTQTFLQLSRHEQESALASYMYAAKLRNYTKNHVTEILKRLDTPKKELTFHLLGRQWHVNAQHISILD